MKRLLPIVFLLFCFPPGCNSWSQQSSGSVNSPERARLADDLEASETYYLGRSASAVITDEVPMRDLKDEAVQRRLIYLNTLGTHVEKRSQDLSRSSEHLGNFVARSDEQQERTHNITLYKGVQIGLLDDARVGGYGTDGGYIWLTKGAIEICRSEDELAAIVAIQLAHIWLNHPMHLYLETHGGQIAEPVGERADWIQGNSVGASFGRLAITYAEQIMQGHYDTPFNLEADRFALLALLQAGYEPRALVSVLKSMAVARVRPDACDWLKRQTGLERRIAKAASFIAEKEMQVAAAWHEKAEHRQQRFETALGR